MTWYAVYRNTDQSLISCGQVIPDQATLDAKGYTAIALPGNPQGLVWNAGTLSFDAPVPYRYPISIKDILDLFTEAERELLFKAYRQHLMPNDSAMTVNQISKIDAFVEWMKLSEVVSLDHPYFQQSINLMETVGILASGRALEILS